MQLFTKKSATKRKGGSRHILKKTKPIATKTAKKMQKKPSLRAQLQIGRGNPGKFLNWIASSIFTRSHRNDDSYKQQRRSSRGATGVAGAKKSVKKSGIKNKKESWFVFYIVFSIFLFIAICIGYFYYFLNMQVVAKDVNLLIKNGSSIESITNTLYNKQVIRHKFPFKTIARIYSIAGYYLQAGEYFFDRGMRTSEVIAAMIYGSIIEHKITFIEGHTTYDFIQKINDSKTLKGNKLNSDQYGEGLLLASTYKYNYNTTKRGIAVRMNRLLQHTLRTEWDNREEGLPFNTPYEALILASIIEKETMLTAEMPKIASVYINRLKKGMRLQACPTVIYSITAGRKSFGRTVKYEDLKVVSPHNTYLNKGLPPTPICNPSIAAIKAVLHPSKTNYLYFVSNGQRGHEFSVSYNEHLYHTANYKKLKAQVEGIN